MGDQMKVLSFGVKKTPFELANGNVIYLDTSDVNCVARYAQKLDEMKCMQEKYAEMKVLSENCGADEKRIAEIAAAMTELDTMMKSAIDYVFDADICDKAFGKSSILISESGRTRAETVFTVLLSLYEDAIDNELAKSNERQSAAFSACIK